MPKLLNGISDCAMPETLRDGKVGRDQKFIAGFATTCCSKTPKRPNHHSVSADALIAKRFGSVSDGGGFAGNIELLIDSSMVAVDLGLLTTVEMETSSKHVAQGVEMLMLLADTIERLKTKFDVAPL